MSTAWLLENFAANQFGANIFEGSDREVANHFQVQTDARAVQWRWYRPGTTPANKPDLARIWDRSTGTVVWSTSSIPDNGGIGWQAAAIPEVPVLLAGRWYLVATQWNTERAYAQFTTGIVPPAPFPGAFGNPTAMYSNSPPGAIPANWQNDGIYGVDVRVRSQQRPLSWTLQASTPFTETLKWVQSANRYRVTLTTIGEWASARLVAGEDTRRILGGWWAISDGYKSQRYYLDAPQADLTLPSLPLMDGLLLDTGPGSAGTVDAYTVDDLT